MQKAMHIIMKPLEDEPPSEELIDTLVAISVVSKRLAAKLRKVKEKGVNQNGPYERNLTVAQ